ncbi:MAG: reprolysin-like metallopeptidase [Bacteroidota bacterium]
MKKYKCFIAFFLLICSCTPAAELQQTKQEIPTVLSRRYVEAKDLVDLDSLPNQITKRRVALNPCYVFGNYIPDTNHLDHTPIKTIRINIHWLNAADSSINYYGEKAIDFTMGWLHSAGKDLETNNKLWLPYRNEIPVLPTRYRYELTPKKGDPNDKGIYFHFDDTLSYYVHKGRTRNLFDRRVINKYGVQLDSVLNIFVMPHHPDSVASSTYLAGSVGVALGNAIKIAGPFEDKGPSWKYRGVLNHEVGHIFGLNHAWRNDGCPDTPDHPGKCWGRTEEPPCDTMATNNVMDYNALQNGWSPCQIGRVQQHLSIPEYRTRKFVKKTWCKKITDPIVIRDSISWGGAKDLESDVIVEGGGVLTIGCRISFPEAAQLIVKPGGKLILDKSAYLHNDCGLEWDGIVMEEQGALKAEVYKRGKPKIEQVKHPIILE